MGYEDILVEQYGVYKKAKDIPFDKYQEEVVIKCTSGSGELVFYTPNGKRKPKSIKRREYLYIFLGQSDSF
jgi:hypothetical protein